jgi:predicted DNA-binding transcriptional regulator AlpA
MFTGVDVGSGSPAAGITQFAFGAATTTTEPGRVYYSVIHMAAANGLNSVPVVILRERARDPIGTWLASTDGMLLEAERSPAGTYARALDELKQNLGITLTYVAQCLQMQRSAVYRWYDGRQPHPSNRSRLKTLQEFSSAWRSAKLPSLRNYWETAIPQMDATLSQILSAEVLEINALRDAIRYLAAGTIPPKRLRLGFPGRTRDKIKDRERLHDLSPPTSHESDDESGEN